MFLIEKYRPINICDIDFHKKIYDLLQIMSSHEDVPNIIFYGMEGTGKNTMIQIFLQMLFDESVNKSKLVDYNIKGTKKGNNKTVIQILQSNYHIVINPTNNNSDKYLIKDVVKEYAKTKSHEAFKTNRSFKIILINNIDNMSYYAQTALRRTIEKYNNTCRFIMHCKSLSKVIGPLQSRCNKIRVPRPKYTELGYYIIKIMCKEGIIVSLDKIDEIIKKSERNIKKILWMLEYVKYKCDFIINYDNAIKKIVELLMEIDLHNTLEIREIIYNLMTTNIESTNIIKDIVNLIIDSEKISLISKQQIIKQSADIEYRVVNGRREIIQLDMFIITILKILNDNKYVKV
jgi:replication factor C subunit 3/5